ncbi:MAG: twin-arginine translocase subunit TatC [Cytophagales bacterium]|nr:twin-arginine translocase subunit TatC [Bernardetiaceae bacterium]MDW8204447.1 twin-arginine translocase subunit TatC [Cytophagales bacterium]
MTDEKEMSFLDHLEELRWHLIRAISSVAVFSVIAFLSKDFVYGTIILGPSKTDFWTYRMLCALSEATCIDKINFKLQSRLMTGQFTMHLLSSLVIGIVCAFPYAFWEIWRFVKPGLYPNERKAARGATFFVSLLFMLGILFGYYVVSPLSIQFLANYQLDPSISNEFDIVSYISTLTTLVLATGLMFQLPMVAFFFAKVGLLSAAFMREYRRHAIVIVLVVAAVITPPDVISQILISLPLMLLYEISIWVVGIVEKRNRESELLEQATRNQPANSYPATPLDQLPNEQ